MFGSLPTYIPPSYPPSQPGGVHAAPPYVQAPAPMFTRPAAPAYAAAPVPAPPSALPPQNSRGQDLDEPRLQLPSPEQLGVAAVQAPVDWASVHQRLDRLGATCFHLEKLDRGCRVTCLLPCAQADRSHRIEAEAGSEVEAVGIVVAKAEEWAGLRGR